MLGEPLEVLNQMVEFDEILTRCASLPQVAKNGSLPCVAKKRQELDKTT
jgi:hypothetical protein